MLDNILKFREVFDSNVDKMKALADIIHFANPELDSMEEAERLVESFGSVKKCD